MAFCIGDSCVSCGSCESQCPVGAISAGDSKFEIDPAVCISCGACVSACKQNIISLESDDNGFLRATIDGDCVPAPYAQKLRDGEFDKVEFYLS